MAINGDVALVDVDVVLVYVALVDAVVVVVVVVLVVYGFYATGNAVTVTFMKY